MYDQLNLVNFFSPMTLRDSDIRSRSMNNPFFSVYKTMACSKLFSGDLPEISTYIIQNLRNNVNTLYSLALVNRFWCRLAIPLLWEDPFSPHIEKIQPFIFLIHISCLKMKMTKIK